MPARASAYTPATAPATVPATATAPARASRVCQRERQRERRMYASVSASDCASVNAASDRASAPALRCARFENLRLGGAWQVFQPERPVIWLLGRAHTPPWSYICAVAVVVRIRRRCGRTYAPPPWSCTCVYAIVHASVYA